MSAPRRPAPFAPSIRRSDPLAPLGLTERERGLISLLRDVGATTRAELIRLSGLSGPAIFRATEDLASKGYLVIGGSVAAGRGQPSNEVRLNPDAAFALGISVMTDFGEAAVMDLTGAVRARAPITAPGMARSAVLDNAATFLEEQIAAGLDRRAFVGAGLAIAGFFVGDGSELNPAAELDDWAMIDLRRLAQAQFGVPVIVENSASAAAVGESLLGVGRSIPSFAYVNFAAGFGGGVILDRRLWRGLDGNAGEFGSVLVTLGLFVPNLESLREALAANGIHTHGVDDLVGRFDVDWPGVAGWVDKAAPSIRALTSMVTQITDIGTIVLGGRLPPLLAVRLAAACQVEQAALDAAQRRGRGHRAPRVLAAEVAAQATVIGAASLPLAARLFAK